MFRLFDFWIYLIFTDQTINLRLIDDICVDVVEEAEDVEGYVESCYDKCSNKH